MLHIWISKIYSLLHITKYIFYSSPRRKQSWKQNIYLTLSPRRKQSWKQLCFPCVWQNMRYLVNSVSTGNITEATKHFITKVVSILYLSFGRWKGTWRDADAYLSVRWSQTGTGATLQSGKLRCGTELHGTWCPLVTTRMPVIAKKVEQPKDTAFVSYDDSKLLKQEYLAERLKSSFRKFYGRYGDLIHQYEVIVSLSRILNDILIPDQQWLPNQTDFPSISWHWYRAGGNDSLKTFSNYNKLCTKQNRSTEGCSKLKRSVDMTSSVKNGLNIRTNASPKWDRTRCPEE